MNKVMTGVSNEVRFCDAAKIARVMGVSKPSPLNWFRNGQLPGVKIGQVVRFPIEEVAAILKIKPEDLMGK